MSVHDAYAFTLLRWGGFAGIDPASLPAYRAYIDRVAAICGRGGGGLDSDTYLVGCTYDAARLAAGGAAEFLTVVHDNGHPARAEWPSSGLSCEA